MSGPDAAPSAERVRMDAPALTAFLDQVFPAAARRSFGGIVSVAPGHVRMVLEPGPAMLRPGNIVSGPTQMALADVAAYAVVVAHVGPVEMAVTTTLSINFLRACQWRTVYADARLLRLGRRLLTVDVRLWQEAEDRPAADAAKERLMANAAKERLMADAARERLAADAARERLVAQASVGYALPL